MRLFYFHRITASPHHHIVSTLLKLTIAVFIGVVPYQRFVIAQGVCPFPGGLTLCQQFGNDLTQTNILAPTSTSSLMTNSWNTTTVFINATLTVNTLFTVDNSSIKFGANGQIVVIAGGELRSTDSRYFSCATGGWPGIRAEGGTTIFGANYVEDAHNAITIANSAAFLSITENTFNRNLVDILVPWPVNANAIIAGNLFDCTTPTFAGNTSQIGISAENRTVVFVGLPQTNDIKAKNTFRNHLKGANGIDATMNFRYAEFNCNAVNGIDAEGGHIELRGSGSYRNLFQHNFADISTSGSDLLIFGSDFRECLTDNITSDGNLNGEIVEIGSTGFNLSNTIEIDNNNAFSNFKTGIVLDRPSGASDCKIWGNEIVVNQWTAGNGRTAMKIIGQPGTPLPTSLFRNTVRIFEGGTNPNWLNFFNCPMFDIQIGRAGGFFLFQNQIFTSNTDFVEHRNRWGFYLHDYEFPAPKSELQDNDVLGNQTFFDHGMCSYHFIRSGPMEICDNTADYTLRGFHITDDCATSNFAANRIGHHSRTNSPNDPNPQGPTGGLQMEAGSKLGAQFCKHNIWDVGNYMPDWGAWHKGLTVANSRFDYNPSLPGENPNPKWPNFGWFFAECDSLPTGGHCGVLLTSTTLDEFEQEIVQENQTYTPPASVLDWEERKQLMAKLIRYPDLKTTYPLANTFNNTYLNSSEGQFAQFDEMLHNARLIAAGDTIALNNIQNQISYWIGKVDSLDGTLENISAAENAGTNFFTYRSMLLNQIGQWLLQKEALLAQIESDRNADLVQCNQYLATLPANTIYEANQKFLNELAIKLGQKLTFTESDLTMLRIIAGQCPEVAGYTRERAMNQLPVGDPAIYRPDVPYFPGCQGLHGEGEERDIAYSTVQSGIKLSPNPVANLLTIQFDISFTGSVEILDLTGQQIKLRHNVYMEDELFLPVEHLSPGIYLLLARADSGERSILKFVISK